MTPWTTQGLAGLTINNYTTQTLFNLAYVLEKELQKSGVDRSYDSRTSNDKKLVFTSIPTNPKTLYPVIVIYFLNAFVDPYGRYDNKLQIDAQITIFGNRFDCDQMLPKITEAINTYRETLSQYNMFYEPTGWQTAIRPTERSSYDPQLYMASLDVRFYAII